MLYNFVILCRCHRPSLLSSFARQHDEVPEVVERGLTGDLAEMTGEPRHMKGGALPFFGVLKCIKCQTCSNAYCRLRYCDNLFP